MNTSATPAPTTGDDIQTRVVGHTVQVSRAGQRVATANVTVEGDVLRVDFSIDHGHLPVTVRHELVEAFFGIADDAGCETFEAAIPIGDGDLLRHLERHCQSMKVHAAGATCLVTGTPRRQP